MAGAEVDDDLQSADFGKIRVSNTRYDIFAGLLQPLRMIIPRGPRPERRGGSWGKNLRRVKIRWIAGKFAAQEAAPVPSYFVDAVCAKTSSDGTLIRTGRS